MSDWGYFLVGITVITVWKVASSGHFVYYNCLRKRKANKTKQNKNPVYQCHNVSEINRI